MSVQDWIPACAGMTRTRRLERAFRDPGRAIQLWGVQVGGRYGKRLARISAVGTWPLLFSHRTVGLHRLRGPRGDDYAVRLTGRWRLIVRPGATGDQINIVDVEDYHE